MGAELTVRICLNPFESNAFLGSVSFLLADASIEWDIWCDI